MSNWERQIIFYWLCSELLHTLQLCRSVLFWFIRTVKQDTSSTRGGIFLWGLQEERQIKKKEEKNRSLGIRSPFHLHSWRNLNFFSHLNILNGFLISSNEKWSVTDTSHYLMQLVAVELVIFFYSEYNPGSSISLNCI